jgi:hypothetical protein
VRQWYEGTQGGLFGHAVPSDEASGKDQTAIGRSPSPLASKEAEDSSTGAAQGVCGTVRTDRDGGYPCS